MTEHAVSEPFHEFARQCEANRFGMLVFLASEIMLFGGIFAAAMVLRLQHQAEYQAASGHMKLWLGTANTAILLTSSLLAALAMEATRGGYPRRAGCALGGTVLLALVFLGIKGAEYYLDYSEGLLPGAANAHFENRVEQLFMNLYFVGTGLHAVHVTVGIGLLTVTALLPHARQDRSAILIGNAALYWHIVDIVWIFLYPTIYLAGVK